MSTNARVSVFTFRREISSAKFVHLLTEEALFVNLIANFIENKPFQAENLSTLINHESATGNTTILYLLSLQISAKYNKKPVLSAM